LNQGKTLFSQFILQLSHDEFHTFVVRYDRARRSAAFSCFFKSSPPASLVNPGHGFGFGYLCGYWEDYCVPARYEERCVQVWVADPVVYETFGGRLGWGRFDRRHEYRHF
jgi:hypothetical protein